MLWDSLDLTKKSAATRSLNNIIPVLYSLGFDGQLPIILAEENITSERMKQETEGFLMSDFKNIDNETDEEASRTTQV